MRRSRLWSLILVLDALRAHAAQYKTRPSQAGHVAERAGPSEARGTSQLLAGELQGPRGWNCRAHSGTAGGGGLCDMY
jgi:hypothetical protein